MQVLFYETAYADMTYNASVRWLKDHLNPIASTRCAMRGSRMLCPEIYGKEVPWEELLFEVAGASSKVPEEINYISATMGETWAVFTCYDTAWTHNTNMRSYWVFVFLDDTEAVQFRLMYPCHQS